jgi:DNA-binding response OmpR family regulator
MPTILIIDDEEPLRRLLAATLTAAGYTVYQAADGRQGLDLFHAAPADLVLTDLIMPGKEGLETIMQLRQLHPRLRIIAMSGGSAHSKSYLDLARGLGARRLLAKPFTADELTSAITEVLAEAQPPAPPSPG